MEPTTKEMSNEKAYVRKLEQKLRDVNSKCRDQADQIAILQRGTQTVTEIQKNLTKLNTDFITHTAS